LPIVGELVVDVRRLLATVRSAHPGWDWALTMNPETFALIDTPVQRVEHPNPHTGARYTAPALWGAEVWVLQLLHEVVLCSPVGTPDQAGPWPATYYLDLGTRVVSTTPPSLS
jgi:hypothetical protein